MHERRTFLENLNCRHSILKFTFEEENNERITFFRHSYNNI